MKIEVDRVSKEARDIEKKIDLYQKNNPIFNIDRKKIIYKLLEYINAYISCNVKRVQDANVLENFIDGADRSLKWIYEYCDNDKVGFRENYYNIDYEIVEMVDEAIRYNHICKLFILVSNGVLRDKVSKNGNSIYFEEIDKNRMKRVASDLLNFSELNEFKRLKQNPDLQISAEKMLDGHIILNKYLNIKKLNLRWVIDNKLEVAENYLYYYRTFFENKSEFNSDNKVWNNWEFEGIRLHEFKEFYYVLCSISEILIKIKPNKVVEILPEEIEYIVSKLSYIKKDTIKKLIDFYTYKNNTCNRNINLISTPLVKEGEYILLAPHIVISSLVEKNILDLINRKEKYRKYYNELSKHKEEYVIDEIINKISKYESLNIVSNKELPKKYGEIDILLLDKKSKSMMAIEVKSLLKTGSSREALNKREDIEKGIKQCKNINEYLMENLDYSLHRFFNDKNIKVENIYSCVVTQNEIINTIMDYSIKVINKNDLYDIFKKFNGNLLDIINYIEDEKYLPQKNIDYRVLKDEIFYAGYKFRSNVVYDINNKEVFKLKANERAIKKKK